MTSTVQAAPEPAIARVHPLEPLSAAEIEAAAKAVTAAAGLGPSARFVYVSLYEPPRPRSSRSKPAARPPSA